MLPRRTCALLALVSLVVACSSAPPRAPARPPPPPPPPRAEPALEPPQAVHAEIGGLNQEAMEKAFAELPVQDCFTRGASRVASLGGHLVVKLRISTDGSPRWAYLRESTVGDRETEKCVLDLVRARTWPRPLGGDGLAERAWEVDAGREPASIDEDNRWMQKALGKARTETAKCRQGIRGSFLATAYVRRNGRVRAAGVAPPHEKGEEAADCIVEELLKLHFPSGGREGKFTFELR